MAYGLYAGGDGTVNNPYLLEDAHDLFDFCNKVSLGQFTNMHAKIIDDIDMDVAPYNEGIGWQLGGSSAFNGTLDGGGHTIDRFYLNGNPGNYRGCLFASINTGTVKNILFTNSFRDTGNSYQGLVAGAMTGNGIIENIGVRDSIFIARSSYSAFIVGSHTAGDVRYCYIENCNLTDFSTYTGGITGNLNGGSAAIYSCYVSMNNNMGNTSNYTGLVIGYRNSYNSSKTGNLYFDTSKSYWSNGNSGDNLAVGMSEADFRSKHVAQMLNVAVDSQGDVVTWLQVDNDYPRLWFEDFRRFLIVTSMGEPINNIDFGAVLEGSTSKVKRVRLKNGYKYRIKGVELSWSNGEGVTDLTELQFSKDGTDFQPLPNPALIDDIDVERGRELSLYARVVTQEGISSGGLFNISLKITSAE